MFFLRLFHVSKSFDICFILFYILGLFFLLYIFLLFGFIFILTLQPLFVLYFFFFIHILTVRCLDFCLYFDTVPRVNAFLVGSSEKPPKGGFVFYTIFPSFTFISFNSLLPILPINLIILFALLFDLALICIIHKFFWCLGG